MNLNQIAIAGPYTHENLSIFLLLGRDDFDGNRFIPLDDALEQKCVVIHETGNIGELEAENLSDLLDLYVQAGDVVKGGRQDRTLRVDFVLPAKSGRVPVPSFCVESGRWHQRAAEAVHQFSSSKSYLSSAKLRMAAKLRGSQKEVWAEVAEAQAQLSRAMGKSLQADHSPTSYQLSVEDVDLKKRVAAYRTAFARIVDEKPDAVGFAFVINGKINTADIYGSGSLFRKLWNKLLDAAVLEAIAGLRGKGEKPAETVTSESIQQWFLASEKNDVSERREVPPRVRMDVRRGEKTVVFDTCDHAFNDAVLHKNLIAH